MNKKLHPLIYERLKGLKGRSAEHALNVAKEVVQELVLLGLARVGFFSDAAFHGGTAFRIFYGLDRFSEDLDFCLQKPDANYNLNSVLEPLKDELESWGISIEITDRNKLGEIVKKAFLKETSLGALLSMEAAVNPKQKLLIKLEVDTNPPAGARYENKLCDYPINFYVLCHDLESMFAGKLHALLRREYLKGRDWYDLLEYFNKRAGINFTLLRNALIQSTPHQTIANELNLAWVKQALSEKIEEVDFNKARDDVRPFVKNREKLELWSKKLFLDKLDNYTQRS